MGATIPTVLLAGDVETTKFSRPDIKTFSDAQLSRSLTRLKRISGLTGAFFLKESIMI
ncbi:MULTISPECIES: hypothetical protein [unclassified Peribacillus]|uniref:hypothetical protein n=1 Tax=unclassified Peribacillus TaxID=2675266 RepID=UPI00191241D5|nr:MULTISPECIES: hypothetical protein [unclassified Peribacillus]MBK5442061.1 hypothetical protein [Peribacillus sp. TH24]MBK5483484.1 hypothetical protein [Peribacillus sp. TH16]MBK5501407.1 hypothetical protein [Peribacillus sp. TH14]